MTDIIISAAAIEAGARRFARYVYRKNPAKMTMTLSEDEFVEATWTFYEDPTRAACLAMLAAWEGAKTIRDDGRRQTYAIPALILPLPQEKTNG